MKDQFCVVKNLRTYFPAKSEKFLGKPEWVRAVDGVSFSVGESEIVGLVGESGSGKTTVGKSIIRLLPAMGGSVYFRDKCIFDVEEEKSLPREEMGVLRKSIQMIFQDPYSSLDPKMNVEQIVSEGMAKFRMFDKAGLRERSKELLDMCGLGEEALRKYPNQFSGGQRQRIGIARALSLEPELIICDEPTAALDVSIQSQILNLMLNLRENLKISYLFISHNLSVVENLCERVCVMYLGTIVETGYCKDIFASPAHPYTEALISAVPTIKGRKEPSKVFLKGEIPSPQRPPSGCKFHPRCPRAKAVCATELPPTKSVGEGHTAACHFV